MCTTYPPSTGGLSFSIGLNANIKMIVLTMSKKGKSSKRLLALHSQSAMRQGEHAKEQNSINKPFRNILYFLRPPQREL